MRKILICCVCIVAVTAAVNAQSFSHYTGEYGSPGVPPSVPGPNSITQSADTSTVTQFNSVSCNAGGLHTDNSYIRRFFLNADHGIVSTFAVESLDWAIETAAGSGGSQPVVVNLYSIASGAPLTFANMTAIGSTPISVADTSLSGITTTVSGVIADPLNEDLVVEVFTPDGQGVGNSFFIGSNPNGETQPSYIAAAACGLAEPATMASIGFGTTHVIMVVNGIEGGVPTMGGVAFALLALLLTGIAAWIIRQRAAQQTI